MILAALRAGLLAVAADAEALRAVSVIGRAWRGADNQTTDTASLSTADVAIALGVSAATMRRLARMPGAPVTWIGRAARWDLDRTRAWLAERGPVAAAAPTDRPDPDADRIARRAGLRIAGAR